MKRIILKCKLKNRDAFESKLNDIELNFSPVYWQHDRVYVPRSYKKNSNFPRLIMRTEIKATDKPAKYYFILKRHIEDSGVDLVEEIPTKDYEKMVSVILQLGFKPITEISRRRQTLKMGEGTTIYLDKIETLPGYYAKIESDLDPNDSITAAKLDLEKTFKTLGESTFVESAYFEM